MRQIVLDTETTGLETADGHRIIEIGCVELISRRQSGNNLHLYLNPEREIDSGAQAVHGLSNEFLADKPVFADVCDTLLGYLGDAELIIHNAPFDLGFLNAELRRLDGSCKKLEQRQRVTDSLVMARKKHPGQKCSLDALCKRYLIDNSQRTLHGALLDAQLLAEVYLAMTGGQNNLMLDTSSADAARATGALTELLAKRRPRVHSASAEELQAHETGLALVQQASDGQCLWLQQQASEHAAE